MRLRPLAICLTALLGVLAADREALAIDDVQFNAANGHYYKRYTELVTWTQAKAKAEEVGGYLVTVTSAAENTFIKNNVSTSGGWIGLSDSASEGTYVWVSGETYSYTNWNAGEPNNANGGSGGEDYAEYGGAGGWNDEPNTDTQGANAYFVEWDENPNAEPDAPENLSGSALNDRRIQLSWTDASDVETGHEVERALGDGAFSRVAVLSDDVETYTDTGLVGETEYRFRVRATNDIGPSDYSNIVTISTLAAPIADLDATALSNRDVQLTWVDQTDEETAIAVERSLGCPGLAFTRIATLGVDVTSYVDEGLLPQTTYSYRVRAITDADDTEFSPEACITMPPSDPDSVGTSATSDRSVTITWYDPSDNELGFEIERGLGCPGENFQLIATVGPDTESYTDTTAEPETTYAYRVRAFSEEGASDWTPEVCVTTPPFAPTGLSTTILSGSRVQLDWTDNSNVEEGYEVMRRLTDGSVLTTIAQLPSGATSFEDTTAFQETSFVYQVAAFDVNGRSGWAVAKDAVTPAQLVILKASIARPRGRKPRPTRMTVIGEFDVGEAGDNLSDAATLLVGEDSFSLPGFTKAGPNFKVTQDGVKLLLRPNRRGSSRVGFKLILEGETGDAILSDGDLTVGFEQGDLECVGTITLAKDRFIPGRMGHLVDPALVVQKLSARLKPAARDALRISGMFEYPTAMPSEAPEVVIKLGVFEFTAKSELFQTKGSRHIFSQRAIGLRSVILDYARGRVMMSFTNVDLGDFEPGAESIPVSIDIGPIHFADTPVLSVGRGSLGY